MLAELVERHEPEVPVTSGPDMLAAAVEEGTAAAAAGTAEAAGTAATAGTAGVAGGEDGCCCQKQRGQSSSSCPPSPSACAPVERAVNQVVEVVEAEVEERVLEVVLKTLHEVHLLLAVIRNLGMGVASKLQKTITILRDRHSPLK